MRFLFQARNIRDDNIRQSFIKDLPKNQAILMGNFFPNMITPCVPESSKILSFVHYDWRNLPGCFLP